MGRKMLRGERRAMGPPAGRADDAGAITSGIKGAATA